ncbi:MAG: FAD-binding protein [Coriobacteriales bacterium]|nr:FAD-binding protein [Coriobacteriales bacterium]
MENIEDKKAGILTRRDFLAGAGASAALAAGAMAVGCSPTASSGSGGASQSDTDSGSSSGGRETATSSVWKLDELDAPAETLECELCVIGDGGGGVAAAIQAHQLGVDVLLLSKFAKLGGSFIGSEGLCAFESHWQKDVGEDITVEEAELMCLDYHHWIPDPALYLNFFRRTADTVTWLEGLGVEFDHVQSLCGSPVCWHVYKGDHYSGTGIQFMESFAAAAEAEGIRIEFNNPGKQLIVENGTVTGVLAQRDDGTVVQINCKTVFVATGGYASNNDIIRDLNGADTDRITPSGMLGRDGDGIKMMRAAGAAFAASPGTIMFYGPIMPGTTYGTQVSTATSLEPTLWVNQDGVRYADEYVFNTNFAHAGNAVHNQKRAFNICNQATLDRYAATGGVINAGVYTVGGEPMDKLMDEFQKLLDSNSEFLFQADTIEDLAKQMGVDPVTLKTTFDNYESFCANGKDLEFGKDPQYLNSIVESPYFAFEIYNGYFTTVGGIKITKNTEVVSEDGEIIKGLYAGGSDAGGLYGDTYDVARAAGSQASWAVNSGRIAAKYAAKFLGKQVDPTT